MGRIIRPDNLPADSQAQQIKLHAEGVEFPMPTTDGKSLLPNCMRNVSIPHPETGVIMTIPQLAMTADAALVLIEAWNGLQERDARIDALEQRLKVLEELTRGND